MRILHTGDWHLGKHLEGVSRLEEQTAFLEDFIQLVEKETIDLILIAGDVYDAFNPPSQAETLFYSTLKRLSDHGKRMIVVIPGNHDNPSRLSAAGPLAKEHGIVMVNSLTQIIETGIYGTNTIISSGEGFIEVEINKEKAVLITLPYPSEKRLEEVFLVSEDDQDNLMAYQDKIKALFDKLSKNFREDTLNIVMSHLFANGAEETGSERSIQLGGSYIIDSSCFPKNADYVALGHIHKPMIIKNTNGKVRYSGSPLHYNKKEIPYKKGCYLFDSHSKDISFIPFKVYKPIEIHHFESLQAAFDFFEKPRHAYIYMTIKTEEYIKEHDIKKLKRLQSDLLEITPIFSDQVLENKGNITEEPIEEIFNAFYFKERGIGPSDEIKDIFNAIIGGLHETD